MAAQFAATLIQRSFERHRLPRLADGLAAGVAAALPWSTSASAILQVLWLAALLPTVDLPALRRQLAMPAAFLPVLLFVFGLLGVLWADAPLPEVFSGFKVYVRLLAVPLLLVQFQNSNRGAWVIRAFLVSCGLLLALSWLEFFVPALALNPHRPSWVSGVPVKDYIIQSGEFLICAFGLVHLGLSAAQRRQRGRALLWALLALVFLADMAYVATARSTLIVFAVLVVVFALQRYGWRGSMIVLLIAAAFSAAAWFTSPYLRGRVFAAIQETRAYEIRGAENPAGYRLEFWKKSINAILAAPVIGHGTGSTLAVFRKEAAGKTGIDAIITSNPHNQFFLLAVELGLVGAVLLCAVWAAHLLLFRGTGLIAWIGMGVVVQNVVSCLFNSYLFESTLGWLYIFGVGVLGGMTLRTSESVPPEIAGRPRQN